MKEFNLDQVTRQHAINYWTSDNITEEDTNCFVDKIKNSGFHNSVPIDAQMAMKAWANCDATEANAYYLKAFAEIARAALGIE